MAPRRPQGNTRTGQADEFALTDTVLKTREVFDKEEKKDAAQNAVLLAPDADMDVTQRDQRIGRTMTTPELEAKLKAINPAFVVRPSKSDSTRCNIYLPQWEHTPAGAWIQNLTHITSCENTGHPEVGCPMTEFSITIPIEEEVAGPFGPMKRHVFDREVRGWRTVVAMLLIKRVITTSDVSRHFGLTPSQDSARWHELMTTPNFSAAIPQTQEIQ